VQSTLEQSTLEANVSRASIPSDLKITDVRIANLDGVPFRSTILRIDTNQGLSGYGEVRDQASKTYALMLKSRLIGENPCNIDKIFRKIRQFGHHARQAGGVSGIEMALMDLAGKAYSVPAYALVGGQFRKEIRCYADTPSLADAEAMGNLLLERKQRGFTFLKMDLGVDLLWDVPGTVIAPHGARDTQTTMHPFAGIQITRKGVEYLADYVATVRDIIGYDIPLAIDHFGHIAIDSCIRLGRALEPYTLAWLEDMIPWQLTDQWRQLTQSMTTPTCTGEDIYLLENFRPLIDAGAVRIIHPDPATAGGIMETKRIGDYAEQHGIGMALHLAATPIATMASVHIAAATENFLALEHHAADLAWWSELVTGLPQPLIVDGYITVPDTPGLGFGDINPDALREHLDPHDPVMFEEPTSAWDNEISHDRLWS
jgi:L-alanine-DL-glutamate epimerase-like enolase superfamily enzyme